MNGLESIFLDFKLPTATTWFYFSFFLAVALFLKFSRLLSIRNWDVLTLYLLVPGMLLLREAHRRTGAGGAAANGRPDPLLWFGYLWLLCGSAYFLIRCLIDLGLNRRPALSPNLSPGGLGWLGGALFVTLVSVAFQHQQEGAPEQVGKRAATYETMENGVAHAANGVAGPEAGAWMRATQTILCHLAVVAGLIFIGYRHFQDVHAGVAAAAFYLLLPYTALHVEQVHHVWPSALIVWAIAAYRLALPSGVILGLAAGTAYFPAMLLPAWLSFYRRRGMGRFLAGFALAAGLSLAVTALSLWSQGELSHTLQSAMNLCDWQPWRGRPETEGFWVWLDGRGVHWAYRIPIFIAYVAFVLTTAFWPSPKNLAHLLALSAAALIGIQFWYSDQGGVYVLWYLPLLLLMAFRPNLTDRRPPVIAAETDRLARWSRAVGRLARRYVLPTPKVPEPAAPER